MKLTGKTFIVAAFALTGAVAVAEGAAAMPLTQGRDVGVSAPVHDAGWRCGPGRHMNRWGRCVPNGWRRW